MKKVLRPFRGQADRPPVVAMFGNGNAHFEYDGQVFTDMDPWSASQFLTYLPGNTAIYTPSNTKAIFQALGYRNIITTYSKSRRLHHFNAFPGTQRRPIHMRKNLTGSWEEFVDGVLTAHEFMRSYGINLSGSMGMAKRVIGLALDEPVIAHSTDKEAAIGNRAGREYTYYPGFYDRVIHWDINSAYPDAMTVRPLPTRFSAVPGTSIEGDGIAIIETEVRGVDGMSFTPGPVVNSHDVHNWASRSGISTMYTTFEEARLLRERGHAVRVLKTWKGSKPIPERSMEWFREFTQTARDLKNPVARQLIKSGLNSCWAMFMFSDAYVRRYRWQAPDKFGRYKPIKEYQASGRVRANECHSFPMSTIIVSRVRCRLWREALYPITSPLLAKTDAVMAWKESDDTELRHTPDGPIGDRVGEWSVEGDYITVGLTTNPGHYYFRKVGAGQWDMKKAGGFVDVKDVHRDAQSVVPRAVMHAKEGEFAVNRNMIFNAQRHDGDTQKWEDRWLRHFQQV